MLSHQALTSKGLVLIVGPRGCGKTHMMRYTWLECCEKDDHPFAIYASFNRYLRLEPLLRDRSDAVFLFQTWVLGRIILAGDEAAIRAAGVKRRTPLMTEHLSIEYAILDKLIAKLERGSTLSNAEEELAREISVEAVVRVIVIIAKKLGRKRTVLLLDDAALTLTQEYLVAFFDIVRVLRRVDIAPKASVYPGTTEYGPRFHATHEGKELSVWLSVEHEGYSDIMQAIGEHRYHQSSSIPENIREVFKQAAFGIPRAYLTMLREFVEGNYNTTQQGTNRVIEDHSKARLSEYRSLALKVPRLATLVRLGEELFQRCIVDLRSENNSGGDQSKQILIGIPSDLHPLQARMIKLLIEAGLLYEILSVSHGHDRIYRRFIPHLASLIAARVFSGPPSQVLEQLSRKQAKHPLRRSIEKLTDARQQGDWHLDLPPCQACRAARLNEAQKFCHNCGQKLIDVSTFSHCMTLSLNEIPSITHYQVAEMEQLQIQTIGDLLTIQDPGTELRRIPYVGKIRANRILRAVQTYVDEFLS